MICISRWMQYSSSANLLCANRIKYNIVTQHRNGDFPDAEVIILYSSGRYFANGITKAVAYDMNREYPYFIHMSDGSLELDYIMAHEIGHIFNFTNRFDNKNEANPYENPEMAKSTTPTITIPII